MHVILRGIRRDADDMIIAALRIDGRHVGELLLSVGEWQLLGASLGLGAERTKGHMHFETENSDAVLR